MDKFVKFTSGERDDVDATLSQARLNAAAVAKRWQRTYQSRPNLFNNLCIAAMAQGHVELAQMLKDAGADPLSYDPQVQLPGPFHQMFQRSTGQHTVYHALAARYEDDEYESCAPLSRAQVVRHLARLPDAKDWGDINSLYGGSSALVWTLRLRSVHDDCVLTEPGFASEVEAFQAALIDAGASLSVPGEKMGLLEASLPGRSYRGDDFVTFDRVVSWGVDTKTQGGAAWARALQNDAPWGRPKRKPALGPRAKALMARNIPLSPMESGTWDSNPLAVTLEQGHGKLVEILLAQGANLRWVDPDSGKTVLMPLMFPRKSGMDLWKSLPQEPLKEIVNNKDSSGNTALHRAVNDLNAQAVQWLLDLGADPNLKNKVGKTPLQALRKFSDASLGEFDQVLGLLIAKGVKLDAPRGGTALHKAASMLSTFGIDHFLAQGQNPMTPNAQQESALERIVLAPPDTYNAHFSQKRGERQLAALDVFLRHGVEVLGVGKGGNTLFHHAMARRSHLLAIRLLELGANPNASNNKGLTGMHLFDETYKAQQSNDNPKNQRAIIELVDALAKAGADFDRKSPDGALPFKLLRQGGVLQAVREQVQLEQSTARVSAPARRRPGL